jgi:cytochrome c-type biogenesis protein CcmH/NrfG
MLKPRYCLLLGLLAAQAFTADQISPEQFLLNQVLWGEINYRDDFVKNSLHRLELMDVNSPQVVAAQIRLAIREKNHVLAHKLLEQLKHNAPESDEYKQAQMSVLLTDPASMVKLQQARILSMSGRPLLAKAEYDALFHGTFPTLELTAEYWTLVSQIPDERQNAFNHLDAIYSYLQDHKVDTNDNFKDTWLNGLEHTLSRVHTSQGDMAFKANHLGLALNEYQQALRLNQKNYFALVGMGDIALKNKKSINAEQIYKQAVLINPDQEEAIYALLSLYKGQSLPKALLYLDSLPEEHKLKFLGARHELESAIYQQQAEHFSTLNQWTKAVKKYRQAQKIDPDNVWLIYHYALALNHLGANQKANQLFLKLAAKQKNNPKVTYVYALFLSSSDKRELALAKLHTLPRALWSNDMLELSQRLTTELQILHAQKLRDQGDKKGAIAYLLEQKQNIPIKITLADWAFNDQDYPTALTDYQGIATLEPFNADAYLGMIETLIALGDKNKALSMLFNTPSQKMVLSEDMQRRMANAWFAVGESQKAVLIFNRLKKAFAQAAPSESNALIFRDAARVETALRQPILANEDYKQAMVHSRITSVLPKTNDAYTYLTRNRSEDDWLKHSIRSDAGLLYQQEETLITLDEDYWRLKGTPGTSDLRAGDTIAQADWALYNGRAFLRADDVTLGAGTFSTINGLYFSNFGTCAINGCSTQMLQHARGVSWDGGWQGAVWGMDLGQTPVGFPVSNWVGGINYSGELNHIGWTITASRRPMTNSLLSFAGAVDPNTGITWGGLVATGLTLSFSYDRGEANGFWANLVGSELTGKNTASNERMLLMEGYYYKLINEDNRRLTVGLTNMVWHYNKDQSGYTLGQGGYYSPKRYLSFTLPVNYRQRTNNWSYELGGTVTWSRATTSNSLVYPLPNLVPNLAPGDNTLQTGGTSSGYGYSILALVERRLSSHFIIGGLVNMQQSTDYTPSRVSVFLRYSVEGWQGDMDMPIVPLIPYSSFR